MALRGSPFNHLQRLAWASLARDVAQPRRPLSIPQGILALGGSVTRGVGCVDGCQHADEACSYAGRFAQAFTESLDSAEQGPGFIFANRALGGMTTQGGAGLRD